MRTYKISKKALNDYRTGAKRDKNLSVDVLKVKFSCLINSSITKNKKFLNREYVFERCVFTVNFFNTITSIRWDQNYPVATTELKDLFKLYEQNGLNRDGNAFKQIA